MDYLSEQSTSIKVMSGKVDNLRIIGPCSGPTGYDNQVREICSNLLKQGRQFELDEYKNWSPVSAVDKWTGASDFRPGVRAAKASACLHFLMPSQVCPVRGVPNINFSMFEATSLPPEWIAHSMRHDHIIVPTTSSTETWIRSGIPAEKLSTCPLGINEEMFRPDVPPLDIGTVRGRSIGQYRTRMLNVSDFIPRKNIPGLLKAWLDATSADDDAVLIIKAGLYHPEMYQWLNRKLSDIEMAAGKRFEHAAPIHWITDILPAADMPSLYTAATHYISLSHGEGWDLPMMEAGACGLRLIAPRHSAYNGWMEEQWTHFIPAAEIEVPSYYPPTLLSGLRFWQPEHDAAVSAITMAMQDQSAEKVSASEAIRKRYTWSATTKQLLFILDELYG